MLGFIYDGNVEAKMLTDKGLEELVLDIIELNPVSLVLKHNRLTSSAVDLVMRLLHSCPQLDLLDLTDNSLKFLGAHLLAANMLNYPKLTRLSLASNHIEGKESQLLMKSLLASPHLLSLDLTDNPLRDEGASYLSRYLSYNKTLHTLVLNNCGVSIKGAEALFLALQSNAALRQLSLYKNPFVKELAKKASSRHFAFLLECVQNNISLLQLEVGGDLVSQSTEALQQNRTILRGGPISFSHRSWSSVPRGLLALRWLAKLDLSNNHLKGLPYSFVWLEQLEFLNLSNNEIEADSMPVQLAEMGSLQTVRVEGNPFVLAAPPFLKVTESFRDLCLFFSGHAKRHRPSEQFKVMVLGHEAAGKTTLVKSLTSGSRPSPFARLRRKLREMMTERAWTDGISITEWETGDGDSLHFWDFAGQETYYPTHQFFITSSSIYLIVVSFMSSMWSQRLTYWLATIESKCANADILVVATHKDLCKNVDTMLQSIRKFAKGRPVFPVNVLDPTDLTSLRAELAQLAALRNKERGLVPQSFFLLKSVIIEERSVLAAPHKTWTSFQAMAMACGIDSVDEVEEAARFLSDTGIICYFPGARKLQDVVVLDPTWLVTVMARLVTDKETLTTLKESGRFYTANVEQIWHSYEFPPGSHDTILSLLEAFEVLVLINNVCIVPCLLPERAPPTEELMAPLLALGRDAYCYQRVVTFAYHFIPLGFLSQLIIRLLSIAGGVYHVWRTGISFHLQRSRVLARFDEEQHELVFDVRTGDNSGKMLYILSTATEALLDGWYPEIKYTFYAVSLEDGVRTSLADFGVAMMRMGNKLRFTMDQAMVPDIVMQDALRVDFDADVTEGEFIAAGAYGSVSKALMNETGQQVVVKRMLAIDSESAIYTMFLKEIWVMSFLVHPNIIKLVGISMRPLAMIIEYMNMHDLRTVLDLYELPPWPTRLLLMMQVAQGMAYAHSQAPPIIHRDLKSPNIFVSRSNTGQLVAKVADLGLATILPKRHKSTVVDNPTWTAPELIRKQPYSKPADVYSFAIIMWELLTGDFPFRALWDESGGFSFAVAQEIASGYRPSLPQGRDAPDEFYPLLRWAWADEPESRPTFDVLCLQLHAMMARSRQPVPLIDVPCQELPPLCSSAAAQLVGEHLLVCIMEPGQYQVTDVRKLREERTGQYSTRDFPHPPTSSCAHRGSLWASDGFTAKLLQLSCVGEAARVHTCPKVANVDFVLSVGRKLWAVGGRSDRPAHSIIITYSPAKTLAKVKGKLSNGVCFDDDVVVCSLFREKEGLFLWRMSVQQRSVVKHAVPFGGVKHLARVGEELWVLSAKRLLLRSHYHTLAPLEEEPRETQWESFVYVAQHQVVLVSTADQRILVVAATPQMEVLHQLKVVECSLPQQFHYYAANDALFMYSADRVHLWPFDNGHLLLWSTLKERDQRRPPSAVETRLSNSGELAVPTPRAIGADGAVIRQATLAFAQTYEGASRPMGLSGLETQSSSDSLSLPSSPRDVSPRSPKEKKVTRTRSDSISAPTSPVAGRRRSPDKRSLQAFSAQLANSSRDLTSVAAQERQNLAKVAHIGDQVDSESPTRSPRQDGELHGPVGLVGLMDDDKLTQIMGERELGRKRLELERQRALLGKSKNVSLGPVGLIGLMDEDDAERFVGAKKVRQTTQGQMRRIQEQQQQKERKQDKGKINRSQGKLQQLRSSGPLPERRNTAGAIPSRRDSVGPVGLAGLLDDEDYTKLVGQKEAKKKKWSVMKVRKWESMAGIAEPQTPVAPKSPTAPIKSARLNVVRTRPRSASKSAPGSTTVSREGSPRSPPLLSPGAFRRRKSSHSPPGPPEVPLHMVDASTLKHVLQQQQQQLLQSKEAHRVGGDEEDDGEEDVADESSSTDKRLVIEVDNEDEDELSKSLVY